MQLAHTIKKLEKDMMNQCMLKSKNGNVQTSKGKIVFSVKDRILKAEIIQNQYLVDHNGSFSSAINDDSHFKHMFPDSNIACGYSQSETKAKYMIQVGIAPYIFEKPTEDLHGKPFSFQFDETSTQQVKKQYDGYIFFYSSTKKLLQNIVVHYLWVIALWMIK